MISKRFGFGFGITLIQMIKDKTKFVAANPRNHILMTYGWRQPGFGIRARWSGDEGATWSEQEILIRTDMANSNLGYPCTLPGDGGAMLTLYYGEDGDGTTAILNSRWTMPNA